MPSSANPLDRIPPWTILLVSMASVQLGSAVSVSFFDTIGPAGTAWLRLSAAAVIFNLLARNAFRGRSRGEFVGALVLGVSTGLMTVAFLEAIHRIPLGTAVAIEFLGPLSVAVLRSHRRSFLIWPVLAIAGVTLLNRPWIGDSDAVGVGYAALAGFGWALYILFTQRIGSTFDGIDGLAVTMPIAGLTAGIVGLPQAIDHLSLRVLIDGFGLALIMPVIPFSLEMAALRRLPAHIFGTFMALEPGVGLIIGILLLGQHAAPIQIVGILLVIVAGIGAERSGRAVPVDV